MSENKPLISVIIPVYNVEKYLEVCIQSVVNQSYKNIEILLIDDGSTDNSSNICENWCRRDERIKVFHKQNGGLSSARNYGISEARGEYIGFVDSDDWVSPEMYSALLELIRSGDYDIATCGWKRVSENDQIEDCQNVLIEEIEYKRFIKELLKVGTQKSDQYAWNKLYRHDVIKSDTYPEGYTDEDVEGTLRCVLESRKKIVRTSEVFYGYRMNPESITGSRFSDSKFDFLSIAEHICDLAKKSEDIEIIEWTKFFRYRADFGVLSRVVSMKLSDEQYEKYRDRINRMVDDLRGNYWKLLFFDWPISRKVLMTFYCINFDFSKKVISRFIRG